MRRTQSEIAAIKTAAVDAFGSATVLRVFGMAPWASVMVIAAATLAGLSLAPAQAQAGRRPELDSPVASVPSAVDDDTRRAAAKRLLLASHFRERQTVALADALRTARSAMADECPDRAAAGRDMGACEANATPSTAMKTRVAARQSDMLDEIMAASETVYVRRFTVAEMDEITRFFRTSVGRRYAMLYPQVVDEVSGRRRTILRRYLIAAASADRKPHEQ